MISRSMIQGSMIQRAVRYLFSVRASGGGAAGRRRIFRSPFPWEWMDGAVLLLYAGVLSWGIPHHRPWIDEAQAWLIARDDSMRDLLLRRLHYEGAPALWHLLLKGAIGLHMPFAGLNWLAGAFALLGVWVLVRFSPFPRIFRWLMPFTFFLQYQYAVIARPYVLFPLLLFLLCVAYCLRRPRPLRLAVVAGLIVNISAHAAILGVLFSALYLWDLYRKGWLAAPQHRREAGMAAGVLLLFCAASVLAAFPAPDAMVKPVATGRVKKGSGWLARWIPPERMPAGAPPLDLPLNEAAEQRAAKASGAGARAVPAKPTLKQRVVRKLRETAVVTADVATFPIAESNALGVAFLAALAFWLGGRGSLRLLLPWLLTVPLAAFIWIYDHHTGMFLLALVAAAWISLERDAPPARGHALSVVLGAVALLVIFLQIGWTFHAMHAETYHQYDAGEETEAFLSKHDRGERIDGFGFETVSLQPYTRRKLFRNWDHTYWLWSNANPIDLRRTEALAQRPDVVVVSDLEQQQDTLYNQWSEDSRLGLHPNAEMIRFWEEHGYRETHRFCGDRYMRAGVDNSVCEVLLERQPHR